MNACVEPYSRRPRAIAHADRLAQAVDLNMVAAGWTPTVDTYLGRVTKARILLAVEEARGNAAASRIDHLKKGEMAERAEVLLAGSGWLPEPLHTAGRALPEPVEVTDAKPDTADIARAMQVSDPEPDGAAEPITAEQDEEAEAIDPELELAHAIAAE